MTSRIFNIGGFFDSEKTGFTAPGNWNLKIHSGNHGLKIEGNHEMVVTLHHNGKPVANAPGGWPTAVHNVYNPFNIHSILKADKGNLIDLHLSKGQICDDSK